MRDREQSTLQNEQMSSNRKDDKPLVDAVFVLDRLEEQVLPVFNESAGSQYTPSSLSQSGGREYSTQSSMC